MFDAKYSIYILAFAMRHLCCISLLLNAAPTDSTIYRISCLRRCFVRSLQLLPLNERIESLHEIFNAQFFALPLLLHTVELLWRNKHAADYLDDSVLSDAIFDDYVGESIDFNADDSAEAENINAQRFVFERSGKINLGDSISLICGHGVDVY